MAISSLNKKDIKTRMHLFAAQHFNIAAEELRDPVVDLLLDSLAEEVYKANAEMERIEERLLAKLQQITYSNYNIPHLTNTLLHRSALEHKMEIGTETVFEHRERGKNTLSSFYPVCNTFIYNGNVRFFVNQNKLYSVDYKQKKSLLIRGKKADWKEEHLNLWNEFENSFWIALELDSRIETLKDLSFYLNFTKTENQEEYLSLLENFSWKIQDEKIELEKGIFFQPEKYNNKNLNLLSKLSISAKINRCVKEKYNNHFFHVKTDFNIVDKKEKFPRKLKNYFSKIQLDSLNQELLWLEINYPSELSQEEIDSLCISINTFPAIKKKLISKTIEIKQITPTIPLTTHQNESFLEIHSVSDSCGKLYYDIPIKDDKNGECGIYSLACGGYERYNFQDAKKYLANLLDKLEKDIFSFIETKKDFTNNSLEVYSQISKFKKHTEKMLSDFDKTIKPTHYLLVKSKEDKEIFNIQYWVSDSN